MSHIFHGVQFCVDFASSLLSFKEKQEIRRNIVDNGGTLSYILTKQISYLVTSNSERTLSSYKGRTAVKNGIAVVSIDFVKKCIESGKLLDPQPYLLSETRDSQNFSSGKIACQSEVHKKQTKSVKKLWLPDINKIQVWKYKSADAPFFNEQSYEIAKDLVLKGTDSSGSIVSFYSLELHVVPPQVPCSGSRYRLFTHHGNLKRLREGDPGTKECRYFSTVEDALDAYTALDTQQTQAPYSLTRAESVLSHKIGSDKMIQITVSEYCPEEDTVLSPEVANLIDFIWNEATGSLSDILAVPADSIKLEDVEKAEAVLLLLRKSLDSAEDSSVLKKLSDEFLSIIPHKNTRTAISSKYLIAQKQDLCQLIKDMVSVGESTNWLTRRSLYSKYRALKCHIEWLQHESDEFKKIQEHVNASETSPSKIQVLNVFSIMRPVEEGTFSHDIQNKKLLFHSSKVTNFVGILSRGLLMPKIIVEDFGGKRSDAGMLGSGIYFASSASTSAKYSAAASNGTRLMLVNEVALGNIKEFRKFSMDLTSAPTGFDSCHGVQNTEGEPSDFKDDEFAIYSGNQQRLRYLVEFVLPGDNVLPRDDVSLDSGFSDEEVEDIEGSTVDLSDVMSVVDPLTKVEAGLKGTGDKPLPLQSVHIRAKLLDLAAQVIVFQAYKNNSSSPIEAKYVFPLDDMAAVCGFEAFINGKHIVGEVKEKEQAHKEYREAISQGHGAYLMDEETPDVFTVSVGNLPPGAQVLIKITYVAELLVEREHICFSLPGSVAPWKRNKALEEITQTDVDTVHIDEKGSSDVLDVSVEVSVEMPFDIRTIDSPSHSIRIKRTATKAVVSLEDGQSLEDGFQLLIGLAEIHVPRMWVERHISKPDSQACMLTFYPEFEAETPREVEVLFLLDLSCSMKGPPLEDAKKILLMCLSLMNKDWIFNILVFGSKQFELFPSSKRNDPEAYKDAVKFVQSLSATKGSTELWRVLQKLSLLPAVSSADHPRNLFLISDGHVTEEETTLCLIHKNYRSDRLFTFGVGATANRYYLRAMSKAGAGASEFFDSKVKSKWERKVKSQLSKAEQPGLTSVAVSWQQHDSGSSPPVQAPHQILSLFNGSRQVVYGFVDNCTQATLSAEVNGKTVSTMVYTSDLNITTGKILHQLTARALIRDWDEGSLHEQRTGHEVVKRNRKDYIISISKEFSVVSKFTSFVAVEHREKDEKFEEGQGPSIEELVAAEEIDILQYIGWEQKPVDTDRRREPCIEEKLEKQLQEAEVLETCAVLQCERLYNDVMKEARDKLGPDHPLTTKTAYALSNLYQSVFGDKEKALQVIITDNVLDDHSEDEDFEDSEDDDWSSDEWSEQDELPEALLMQQDDQEKRSTTSGSSPSGSDEVDGKEEEDLQQIEDSSIEEVDTGRREKRSERKWLTNLTRGDSDSAPSEAGEQEMSMAISKSAACSFVDDEEEKSEDDVGFGVYGAFKKFAGKVTNKALQSEESPKYSPTSPSLQIEETTLSPSKKELKRSRSKGVSTGDASDLLESAECVPEPRIGRIAVRLGSTRRGRPARKPALQDFSFDQSTQQLQKPPPSPPFPPPPPGASVTTAPPLAYAGTERSRDLWRGAEIVGGGLHTSEAVSATVEPEREIRPPQVESSLSGFTLNSVDPDRRGVCFGSSSTGEVGGFGLLVREKKKAGFPPTGLFGSAPDRQGFSFGSPSTGEIVGFGQSVREKKKPGFSATELFGSAPDRQNLSFGSPSSGEIVGFGQSAHEKEKSGIPATGLFGSSQSAPSIVGGGLFGNREPRLLAGQSELTAPSFSSGQQSFGSVPSVTSGGGSLFGVPIPAVQAVTVVKDGGEKAEIIEERTGSLEESDGSLADIDFPIAMSKKKKKKRAVIIEEELTQLSDETEPPMPIRQDQAVPAYPFLRSTFNLPTSKAPSSLPSGSKSSVPPSHHPPPPPPPPPPPSPPCSVDPVTTVPPAPPFPPLIVGGVEKRSSSLRRPLRPPAGISVPTPPFSSRVSASVPSRRQQLLSSIKSSVPAAASFGGHRITVHSALMRAQQQQPQALFARSYKGMTMQTDIPVAVSEGVTNRACDSAVSETVGECGSVASPEATLLSEWRESAGVTRGGSPDGEEIMAEEERTNKKVNEEELERKMLGRRRGAVSNRKQRDRNETMEKIFAKQNPDGFWNVDDLSVIGISKRNFINFLGNAGARSLGPKVFELALQLLSTLVILAFIKLRLSIDIPLSLPFGKKRELKVDGLGEPYSRNITAALGWIKIQEQKIPLLYSRLEFGVNWDVATRNIVQEMAV